MGQIGGHNVRLEDIDIHAYAHGLSAANGAHGRNGRLAVIKRFAPEIINTTLSLDSLYFDSGFVCIFLHLFCLSRRRFYLFQLFRLSWHCRQSRLFHLRIWIMPSMHFVYLVYQVYFDYYVYPSVSILSVPNFRSILTILSISFMLLSFITTSQSCLSFL